MAAKKTTARSRNGAVRMPDALGNEGRASLVAQMLASIQAQAYALDVEKIANELEEDDVWLASDPGSPRTIKERRAELKAKEKRLADAYADLMPRVREILAERAAAEAAV